MAISLTRNLFRTLIFHSIQRSRAAEILCRLSISLKIIHESDAPLIRISISDTGVGSSLEEFQRLDLHTLANSSAKWDGSLSITTTGINDKEIQHFSLNLKEVEANLVKLSSTYKNLGSFSGTEVCFSIQEEEHSGDFVLWAVGFLHKLLLLKNTNILFGLFLEQIEGQVLKRERLIHENNESHVPFMLPSIECVSFGLKEFALKHGFDLDKQCQTCSLHREVLMEGRGVVSNSEKNRMKDQIKVEVIIVIAPITAQHSCWSLASSTSQVLCFEDYTPVMNLESSLDVLSSIDWQFYGFKLKNATIENEGVILLEWDYSVIILLSLVWISLSIVTINTAMLVREISVPDRNLVKKAIKSALDDLKSSHTRLFLSSQSIKVRAYVPDLSRALAGLIFSSNDSEFKGECAELLGLSSLQSNHDETLIESCISHILNRIIESNDTKSKSGRNTCVPARPVPSLFECGSEFVEEDIEEADEDYLLGY